jgi:glycosyltransferase involved in cell wall biosynthesis
MENTVTSKPRVSVVVPIYRGEQYLRQCVDSLIAQTLTNIEIVLVNDGSPDGCPAICDEYARIDRRIKVIHKPNGGLVSARKAGLAASTGEYIGYVDGDDWVEPEMYGTLLDNALRHGADVVAAGHKEELDGQVVEVLRNPVDCGVYDGDRLVNEIYPRMLYSGNFSQFGIFSYVWNKLFRREVVFENQMRVDDRIFIGEDASCVYPSLLASKVVSVTDAAHYHYRQRVDSSIKTRENALEEIKKLNVMYHYLKQRFSESGHADLLLHQVDFFLLSLLTVRSDGRMFQGNTQDELCPFKDVQAGGKMVICGAGTFGQHLYRRLQRSQHSQVMGWVDELFEEHRSLGLAVSPLSSIRELEYDHVLVAFIDETVSNAAANKLIALGVPEQKIARVSHYKEADVPKLLCEFGMEI